MRTGKRANMHPGKQQFSAALWLLLSALALLWARRIDAEKVPMTTSPWQQKYICRSDGLIWNESVCLECVSSHAEASDSAVKVEVTGK